MTIKSQLQELNRETSFKNGFNTTFDEDVSQITSQTIDTLCDEIGKLLPVYEKESPYRRNPSLPEHKESTLTNAYRKGTNTYRTQVLQLLDDIKQGKI